MKINEKEAIARDKSKGSINVFDGLLWCEKNYENSQFLRYESVDSLTGEGKSNKKIFSICMHF